VTGFIEQDSKKFAGDVSPYLMNVSSYSNTEVVVYFSEDVEQGSAEQVSNYSMGGLSITSATRDTVDYTKVSLITGSQGDGTQYTLGVSDVKDMNSNSIASPSSMQFVGTGAVDNIPPKVFSAELVDGNTVEVRFSEPVDQSEAENSSNYTIKDNLNNSVTVTNATRQSDASKVWVDISGLFSESLYTLTVNGSVQDLNGNSIPGAPYDTASFSGQGSIPQTFGDGPVIEDPMGEGSNNFSLLTIYKGRIYIGPANDDNAVYRFKPDGSDPELVTFAFHNGGNTTPSLSPGPDSEDGIDFIAGGFINGAEYLFIGPAKSGGSLDYIYFTSNNGNILDFDAMDLSSVTGPNTRGVSAMIVFNGDLYVGYPDAGGNRPYLNRVVDIKQNPVQDVDTFNLQSDDMPRVGTNGSPSNGAGTVGIDSFGIYNNELYLANGGNNKVDEDGGIMRSTTATPLDYGNYPGDWSDCTPVSHIEWYNSPMDDRFSLELANLNKLIPADKAFPAMAEFNNKLYVIRNTVGSPGGPQLWKHDGSTWSPVADNGTGISDMGNPKNSSITMLVVNGDRLYIGFDNSNDGVQVWRTKSGVTDPLAESDFEPVSTDGFGDPANNQRIYHGLSIADAGTDYLWLLCGKSGGSIQVYRSSN
jgi:hypothetical protein